MPDPYASPTQARDYYAGEDASGVTLDNPMGMAADLVAQYAPAPNPVTTDYEDRALRAELEVGRFLFNSQGGSISSVGAEGMTISFTNLQAILFLIQSSMGDYFSGGTSNVAYVEPWG